MRREPIRRRVGAGWRKFETQHRLTTIDNMDNLPQPEASAATEHRRAPRKKPDSALPRAETQFAYPKNMSTSELRWSRKGRKLKDAMCAYVEPRLLPKLQARTADSPGCNRHDAVDVEFLDACVYLRSWLGYGECGGIAEFPFARLYPVAGGRYNVSVRRLIDWSRAEDEPLDRVFNAFWFQAPNARFWVKIATHKTFEECIELLIKDPSF
jgi:hypothetical protein